MDCEFVGVGPLSKNALGEVFRLLKDFKWFVVAKNHKYLIYPLYLQVDVVLSITMEVYCAIFMPNQRMQ